MALKDDLPLIVSRFKAEQDRLSHNNILFNIYEGDLLTYVKKDLIAQMSPKAYEQIVHRIAPINVLRRVVDKLSAIYAKPPQRTLKKQSDAEKALFDEIYECMDANTVMAYSNEYFNLFKNTFVEPFLDKGKPSLRVIPSDRFIVMSTDTVNPARPTHFCKIMGKQKIGGVDKVIFHTYTDEEFLIHDDESNVLVDQMIALENEDGVNPYGVIPGVYINRSRQSIVPQIDTDTLSMTKLFPVLLSDLNFAVMYQCFSIIWTKNMIIGDATLAPNAVWEVKTDPSAAQSSGDTSSDIGVIKPEVDSDKALSMITTQLALWLESKNIKPGSAQVSAENVASGVSKMVDEMDTVGDRVKQVPYYIQAEKELANVIFKMHAKWKEEDDYALERGSFSQDQMITVQFAEQRPVVNGAALTDEQIKRLDKGLQTRKRAWKAIEPDLTDEEIDALILEADAEKHEPIPTEGMTDEKGNPVDGEAEGDEEPETANPASDAGSEARKKAAMGAPEANAKGKPKGLM